MKKNIGTIDRTLRAVIGAGLLALVFTGPQTLWGLIGIPLLLTALIGWCPPYHLLGISTCKAGACKTGGAGGDKGGTCHTGSGKSGCCH